MNPTENIVTRNAPAGNGLRPEQTAEGWDAAAESYARHLDPVLAPYSAEALRIAPVDGSTTVIDVAAGAGSLSLLAAQRASRVLAVDFSPRLVEILARRAREQGLSNLTAEVMDGQALDVRDGAFDRAFSLLGLMVFPDRAAGFRELRRVLRPGGVAVVSSWSGPPANEWMATFRAAAAKAFPGMPPPPAPSFMELADPARLAAEMRAGGFEDVRVETVTRTIVWTRPEEFWNALAKASPWFPPVLARIGPQGEARLREAVAAELRAQARADGSVEHSAAAHYARGVKPREDAPAA